MSKVPDSDKRLNTNTGQPDSSFIYKGRTVYVYNYGNQPDDWDEIQYSTSGLLDDKGRPETLYMEGIRKMFEEMYKTGRRIKDTHTCFISEDLHDNLWVLNEDVETAASLLKSGFRPYYFTPKPHLKKTCLLEHLAK